MNLSVPSRFEFELLDGLRDLSNFESIGEVFGSLPYSIIGHGRVSDLVTRFGEFGFDRVKEFTTQAHSVGLEVNYLANSLCLGELAYDREGRDEIIRYLEDVDDTGVDKVTVATPYLLRLIKSEFPSLKVQVSVYAHIDNVQKFRRWEELGADVINLPAVVNRDFRLLREISRSHKAEVELLMNESCLFHCPYTLYHHTVSSHRSKIPPEGSVDYCMLECTLDRLERPAEILRAPWIRPEDTSYYEESFGVEKFKIQGRQMPLSWILRAVTAYSERSYKGNLMDLISPTYPDWSSRANDLEEVSEIRSTSSLKPPPIYIDNSLLGEFFRTLVWKGGCGDLQECDVCRYCDRVAARLVQIRDQRQFEAYSSATKILFQEFVPAHINPD